MKSSVSLKLREPGPTKTCLCFLLWFLIVNLIILVLSVLMSNWSEHNSGRTFDKDFYLKQENSFRNFAIQEIETIYNSSSCPKGWTPLFKNLTTAGNSSYCLCEAQQTGYSLNETLFQKTKSTLLLGKKPDETSLNKECDDSCLKIHSSYSVILQKTHSKLLCAKLLQMTYDQFEVSPNGKCSTGKKLCGKDTRDYLCIDEIHPCPINRIVVKPKIDSDQHKQEIEQYFGGKNFTAVDFSETDHIYYSNEFTDGKVLTQEFNLGRPCYDSSQKALSEKELAELKHFWNGWTVHKCHSRAFSKKENDERYEQLFVINKADLLHENNFFDYLSEESLKLNQSTDNKTSKNFVKNYFSEKMNYEVGIWYKGFINFRNHCKKYDSSLNTFHQLHIEENFSYEEIREKVIGLHTISLCAIILSFVFLLIMFCCKIDDSKIRNQKYRLFFGTLLFVVSTLSLVFVLLTAFYVYNRWRLIQWFCSNDCGDTFTNETFCYAQETLFIFLIFFLVVFILHAIGVIVYLYWLLGLKITKLTKSNKYKTTKKVTSVTSLDQSKLKNDSLKHSYINASFPNIPVTMGKIEEVPEKEEKISSKKKISESKELCIPKKQNGGETHQDNFQMINLNNEYLNNDENSFELGKDGVCQDSFDIQNLNNQYLPNDDDEYQGKQEYALQNSKQNPKLFKHENKFCVEKESFNHQSKIKLVEINKKMNYKISVDELDNIPTQHGYIQTEELEPSNNKTFRPIQKETGSTIKELNFKTLTQTYIKENNTSTTNGQKRRAFEDGFEHQVESVGYINDSGCSNQKKEVIVENEEPIKKRNKKPIWKKSVVSIDDFKHEVQSQGYLYASDDEEYKQMKGKTDKVNKVQIESLSGSNMTREVRKSLNSKMKSVVTIDDIQVIEAVSQPHYIETDNERYDLTQKVKEDVMSNKSKVSMDIIKFSQQHGTSTKTIYYKNGTTFNEFNANKSRYKSLSPIKQIKSKKPIKDEFSFKRANNNNH